MNRRAFTLVEVLISLAMFALAAISLGAAYTNVVLSRQALKVNDVAVDDLARARAALAQTEPLSPAAQAVRKAYYSHSDDDRADPALAAALRAAANQVVPEQIEPPCGESEPWPQSYQLMADSKWEQRQYTRQHLLAIAAELEDLPE